MAQGIAGIPEAIVRSVDVKNTFGTGKFLQTMGAPDRLYNPLIRAGQVGRTAQKAYQLTLQVFCDLQTSTHYSFGAVAHWTSQHKVLILKTVKEIVKFALMFFCPGVRSLKTVKILVSFVVGVLEMELFWFCKGVKGITKDYNSTDYAKVYTGVVFMVAKIANLTFSCFTVHGWLAKKGVVVLNESFSQYAHVSVQIKGVCMYTGNVVSDAWKPDP